MRRLPTKNSQDLPKSLQFVDGKPNNKKAETTYQRWQETVNAKNFPNSNQKFISRYKQNDIKTALEQHYHCKCGFCESYAARWDVEHYRPKSVYYWLAYSWDNLLLSCPSCNQDYKKDKFETKQLPANYTGTEISNIHSLAQNYNQIEQPKLLNPEFDDPTAFFNYDLNGEISSHDERGQYTIETCGLNRIKLSDRRKEVVIEQFKRDLKNSFLLDGEDKEAQRKTIIKFIQNYAAQSKIEHNEFLGYRKYVIKHLLNDLIQQALSL